MNEFVPGVTLGGPHLRTIRAENDLVARDHGVFHVTAVIPLTVSRVATDDVREL
jgi:hypothetical protein